MSQTVSKTPIAPRFPVMPPTLLSARRRLWHRCILKSIGPLHRFGPVSPGATGILTYHRIAEEVGPDPAMLNVSPGTFRQQVEGLLQLGFKPHPLRSLIELSQKCEPFPPRSFVIVFDDGFSDVYRNAWPVLRELKVPATVFLATDYLDSNSRFPFDDWSHDSAATARPLATHECQEMLDSGLIDFGSHTHRHEDFRGRTDDFRKDILQSMDLLQTRLGITEPTFSFPYGFADPDLTHVVRELGLISGLTADSQQVTSQCDPFSWGRFGAIELDSAQSLAAKLDGWYSLLQNGWRATRKRLVG